MLEYTFVLKHMVRIAEHKHVGLLCQCDVAVVNLFSQLCSQMSVRFPQVLLFGCVTEGPVQSDVN